MNPNRTRAEIDANAAKFLRYASRMHESTLVVNRFAWWPTKLCDGERIWWKRYYARSRIVYYVGEYKVAIYKVAIYKFSQEEYLKYVLDGTIVDGEWQDDEINNSNS